MKITEKYIAKMLDDIIGDHDMEEDFEWSSDGNTLTLYFDNGQTFEVVVTEKVDGN